MGDTDGILSKMVQDGKFTAANQEKLSNSDKEMRAITKLPAHPKASSNEWTFSENRWRNRLTTLGEDMVPDAIIQRDCSPVKLANLETPRHLWGRVTVFGYEGGRTGYSATYIGPPQAGLENDVTLHQFRYTYGGLWWAPANRFKEL